VDIKTFRYCFLIGSALLFAGRPEGRAQPFTFATLAGQGNVGSTDGPGSSARFNAPIGVAVDSTGNLYVADTDNHTIRKISSAGVVSTLAGQPGILGYGDGAGTNALFNFPNGVAVDQAGNLYVADSGNDVIRKITPTGVVSTLAGMAASPGSVDDVGTNAQFNFPTGVAVDALGNVYVADNGNHTIRKIDPSGQVSTMAGQAGNSGSADGVGTNAQFRLPSGVAVDSNGSVYLADSNNQTIRKITSGGVVTTFAGTAGEIGSVNATGPAARFNFPRGVALDGAGNLFVADFGNDTIRKITPTGAVNTLAGRPVSPGNADGPEFSALLNHPYGVAVDVAGNVYVADTVNNLIREVKSVPGGVAVWTVAGLSGGTGSDDGTASTARFNFPDAIAVDRFNNLYVADAVNDVIRKITPAGTVTTFAGMANYLGSADGAGAAARFSFPAGVAVDAGGYVYVSDSLNFTVRKITPGGMVTTLAGQAGVSGTTDGLGTNALFLNPTGIALDSGTNIYVADGNLIRKIGPAGWVSTLAGTNGEFSGPRGLAVDSAGNVYVADTFNQTIQKITPGGAVSTFAGLKPNAGTADGLGSAARFNFPGGVAADAADNIYVADTSNATVRRITPGGLVSTLAGSAGNPGSADGWQTEARFHSPYGIAADRGGTVYAADTLNNAIRKVSPQGLVSTLAGQAGPPSSADGTGSFARFNGPLGLIVPPGDYLFVADSANYTIRKIFWTVTTLAGQAGTIGSADGPTSQALFGYPTGIAAEPGGNIYVSDSANDTIRKITRDGAVTTLAGSAGNSGSADGMGTQAQFNQPFGVAVDYFGERDVYVTDNLNCTIRKITPAGLVSTFAGQTGKPGNRDGVGTEAQFNFPTGIAVDFSGRVYVADTGNSTIRVISPLGVVTTLAGQAGSFGSADGAGTNALFNSPVGVAVDLYWGSGVYVADKDNHTIRRITPDGLVSTIAGLPGNAGNADGTGTDARFNSPEGIAVDDFGYVYIADTVNNTIRVGKAAGLVPSLRIARAASNLVLSWPVSASGFALETSGTLSSGAQWSTLSDIVGTLGNGLTLTNSLSNSAAFYRLRQP
jgi:sugar lactone lactonase YvrE